MAQNSTGSTGVGNTKTTPECKEDKQDSAVKYWFFTYNNYTDEKMALLIEWLNGNCKNYIFQEEKGKEGTEHLQGCIELLTRQRFTALKKVVSSKIHWEPVRDITKAKDYCSKVDTRNGKTYSKGWEVKRELKLIDNLYPWQKKIISLTEEEPDDRTINWVIDRVGCKGKTALCKYMYVKNNAVIATGGGSRDIANLLKNEVENGRDLNKKTTFIFNISREVDTENMSYKAIEGVKDGLLTNTKYEAGTLVFNSPHVWIFANNEPEINKLSLDRWKIWSINEDLGLVEEDYEL